MQYLGLSFELKTRVSINLCCEVKFFPSHKAHNVALVFIFLALSQIPPYAARPQILLELASELCSVLIYFLRCPSLC